MIEFQEVKILGYDELNKIEKIAEDYLELLWIYKEL
jgi:hypothetical protein